MSTATPAASSDTPRLEDRPHLADLADFVMASPSSYHAAAETARRLEAAGYTRLDETQDFPAEPGGYLIVRDGAVLAWRIPENATATSTSTATTVPVFRILGAHTDSPTFKLKPHPTSARDGWLQAGVEIYGGPLLNSWLDRELRFAGRLVTRDGQQHLVATGPMARIPQLAIHLDREVNAGLTLDRQKHMLPIWGALTETGTSTATSSAPRDILTVLAEQADIAADQVHGVDVVMADAQRPALFGTSGEFFASGRLDNLSSVHAGLVALEQAGPDGGGHSGSPTVAAGVAGEAAGAPVIPVLAAFDHEELGSASRSGAAGPVLEDVLRRVLDALGVSGQGTARSFAGSWLLSADAGHLVHPNYAERHDPINHPRVNAGPLLKINANQRYSTDAPGMAAFARWCADAGVPFQEFVSNNGVPCGSTIGPISATRLGIRTVDVGIGLLSMHSAREMCGVEDPEFLTGAVRSFFAGV